jgi:hypothetical protein
MLETLRRHTSLLVAVSAIAVLAASQVTAQEGATKPGVDQGATRPAGINADTLDGRHAVGAGATPTERAGQLVATNAGGYLPNDIIRKAQDADKLDGVDSSAFPRVWALRSDDGAVNQADNPVHWKQLKGVPAPIADGKDATGLPGFYVLTAFDTLPATATDWMVSVSCYAGDYPVGAGGKADHGEVAIVVGDWPDPTIVGWRVFFRRLSGSLPETLMVRMVCADTAA